MCDSSLSKSICLWATIGNYQLHSHDHKYFFADDANVILMMTVMMLLMLIDQFKLVVTNVCTPAKSFHLWAATFLKHFKEERV